MKILSVVFMLLGVYIGAGIASGQEVAIYFSRFGMLSIPICIAMGVGFVFFVMWMHGLAVRHQVNSINEFNKKLFPNHYKVLNIFYCVSLIIIISAMFSSNMGIAEILFKDNKFWLQIFTILLLFIVLQGGIKRISRFSNVLVPFTVAFIVILFALTIKQLSANVLFISNNIFLCSISAINYYFLNILFVAMFVISIGNIYTKKEMMISSIICGTIISALLIIISLTIIFTQSNYIDMPIISISYSQSTAMGICATCIVWISIFTTLIVNAHALISEITVVKNKSLKFCFVIAISLVLSLIKFSVIVEWVYLIISTYSIVYFSAVYFAAKRKTFECQNNQNNIVGI